MIENTFKSLHRRLLNRFNLSFKDHALENAFLHTYRENAIRGLLTFLPYIAIPILFGFGVMIILFPHLAILRIWLIFLLGDISFGYMYFRFMSPSDRLTQIACSVNGVLIGWIFAYGLYVIQGSRLQAGVYSLIALHLISVSLAQPIRFIYSVVSVHLIWLGFAFAAFFLSGMETVQAILQVLILHGIGSTCLFASYQREMSTRINFWQQRTIQEREAKVSDLSDFLKKMFGRYLSEEVMYTLIEHPESVKLGGDKRKITMMMTDLRGFTPLSERLDPEQVMRLLNRYFDVMMKICKKYHGTINDIFGDALLVTFGAPKEIPDHACAAIACAIEMQNAMKRVNEENLHENLPEVEMGIGLNTDVVVVGNIGTEERAKFGVVGSGVNLTSRIESYTVGGQILISESTRKDAGEILRIDGQQEVMPKGAGKSLTLYEVGGIAGGYNLSLEEKDPAMVTLARQIPIRSNLLDGKHMGKEGMEGHFVRLSHRSGEIVFKEPVPLMTNLKMNLIDVDDELASRDFYSKIIQYSGENEYIHHVRFTAVPLEVSAYFQSHRQHAKPTKE